LAKHHAHIVTNVVIIQKFKLAHELCDAYDTLYFEDPESARHEGAFWGRKVASLSFASFFDHHRLGGFQAMMRKRWFRSIVSHLPQKAISKLRRSTPAHVAR
jgi:hypothetical protein